MKSLIATLAVATVLAAPVVSFAQQNGPVTRAQVKAELSTLEQAGYNPLANRMYYPDNIQAAEARVHPQQNVAAADTSGYGTEPLAKREAGGPAPNRRIADGAPIYRGR
ncbi:DUF4148 domain-containing protein [Burkholderia guangdongensis]|uniref:DUF4148 domain-containing protein n=1 Tax=Burkholderia guangdongensis TaxID=1792500 RepID=UPI0015CDD8EE|nr:DUF4148 domain-containing protein [Burkholderia guangdongensis]